MNRAANRAAFKVAAALLLKEGEISLGDIRALPFVNDEMAAIDVANALLENYDATLEVRGHRPSSHLPIHHDVIVLRRLPETFRTQAE